MAAQDLSAFQLAALQTRLDALLAQHHQHVLDLGTRFAGMNPIVLDQVEVFYGGLDDLREDRGEFAEANSLAHLHDRMDALQQARAQEQQRGREQGMGL